MVSNSVTSKKRLCLHVGGKTNCNKLLCHTPGELWCGETWWYFIQEDLRFFPGRHLSFVEQRSAYPVCLVLLLLLHSIAVTCSTHHVSLEINLHGGMCLEVERGAAGWPFIIRVMWDKSGCLGQVEEWWVYMRYCSFSWPLGWQPSTYMIRGEGGLDGVIGFRRKKCCFIGIAILYIYISGSTTIWNIFYLNCLSLCNGWLGRQKSLV